MVIIKTAYNNTYPKGGYRVFKDSFVFNKIFVLLIMFCGKSPAIRVAAERYRQPMTTMLTRTLLSLIWLTSVQIFCVSATYGQVSQDDTTILLKAFRHVTTQRKIVYVDTVSAYNDSNGQLLKTIQNGTISDKINGNSLTLTKAEQNHILTQLGQQTVWSDNLFPNSKLIDTDSMWSFLIQMNAQLSLSLNQAVFQKDTLTIKNLRYERPYIFAFAKPIYIRDKTVCLIAFGAMCGGECGETETSFYKKENNKWTKWIIVSAGVF